MVCISLSQFLLISPYFVLFMFSPNYHIFPKWLSLMLSSMTILFITVFMFFFIEIVYNILHLEIYLYLMYLTSYCLVWCRSDNYLSLQGFFTMNENERNLSQFRVALEARGDGIFISLALIVGACKEEEF